MEYTIEQKVYVTMLDSTNLRWRAYQPIAVETPGETIQ